MLRIFRESRFAKVLAIYLSLNLLFSGFGTSLFALTGGPSQPEVQSFEPITTTQMVDPFSGDFTYNIPLMDVGGYPINLSYHSGVTMDQEASWVGLGWNVNPGVINRNMRGLPDDFKNEEIKKTFNLKEDVTFGIDMGFGIQFVGIDGLDLNLSLGINYNNYRGVGMTVGVSPSLSFSENSGSGLTASLGVSSGTNGFGLQPSLSYSQKGKNADGNETSSSAKVGIGYNSRAGLGALTLGLSYSGQTKDKLDDNNTPENKSDDKTIKGKKINYSGSGNLYTFSSPTINPSISMPMMNYSGSVAITFGTELFGIHGNLTLGGFYSQQGLESSNQTMRGYGYMYSQDGNNPNTTLHDFNREKDGVYNENIPNLPLTNYSYDMYSVSGQGIGGVYRPYRNDIGIIHDHGNMNRSVDFSIGGIELGGGNGVHGGAQVDLNTCETTVGKWQDNNDVDNILGFQSWDDSHPDFEPYTFAKVGEFVPVDSEIYEDIQEEEAVRIKLSSNSGRAEARYQTTIQNETSGTIFPFPVPTITNSSITKNRNTGRKIKNEAIQVLTNEEASVMGYFKSIPNYAVNTFNFNTNSDPNGIIYKMKPIEHIQRNGIRKGHHIGEITATTPEGKRYVYATPAYNIVKKEVSFAVNGPSISNFTGKVSYTSTDNTVHNDKGNDHFFSKTETPPYAHSYLLNAILSVDYADVDGVEGPSDNDLGSYTLFNYSKVSDSYRWRTPYEEHMASHNPGLYSKDNDDKANYVYGEKEIWYMHSIETKTHIAVFNFGTREDSKPVAGENGGQGSSISQRLKSITLYSKQEVIEAGSISAAIPVKTVEFDYDYSLSSNLPNASTGKLTLKKLKFKYRNSEQAALNAYEFNYGQFWTDKTLETYTEQNPLYSGEDYDRWGNYSGNPTLPNGAVSYEVSQARPQEFPYTDQGQINVPDNSYLDNKYRADAQAVSWNLTSITLPSGSDINIEYEADDYAFVQNKKAMQMFNVVGAAEGPNQGNSLIDRLYTDGNTEFTYLYVNIPKGQKNEINSDDDVRNKLLRDQNGLPIENLYFKFLLDVGPGLTTGEHAWEYVTGWAPIDVGASGYCQDSELAYIKLGLVEIADPQGIVDVNPISQAGWNYAQLYLPSIAYGNPDINDNGVVQVLKALVTTFTSVLAATIGTNASLLATNSSKDFEVNKSWIRLYNPNYKKKGGGVRVKKILHKDNWNGYNKVAYGQEYDYTKKLNGKTISSGVAAYEPLLGGDENPWRQPVAYSIDKMLAPSQEQFQETPFGESFFPSASVGYSLVNVRSLKYDPTADSEEEQLTYAPGRVEHEFYTAFDFPTKTRKTIVGKYRYKPIILQELLGLYVTDYTTVSQGYAIELNNMHGQMKAQRNYAQNTIINSVDYNYKLKDDGSLASEIKTVGSNRQIKNSQVGIDYDFIVDMRQHQTSTNMYSNTGNLDFFMAAIFPIIIPTLIPDYAYQETRFRSAVTTKVINKMGILESVTATDNTSVITTKNILWDDQTGQVLLTKSTNEFKDDYYSFTYPAHWFYDGMGLAYQNLSYKKHLSIGADGVITDNVLVDGDHVIIDNTTEAWVLETGSTKHLIDENGEYIPLTNGLVLVKVIRSGHKNIATTPVGSIVCKNDPTGGNNLSFDDASGVIAASAIEYTQDAKVFCNCGFPEGGQYNPFRIGKKGIWKQLKSWTYLTERTQNEDLQTNAYKTNIREEGEYADFTEFNWDGAANTDWTFVNEVSIFATQGMELENRDALDIPSSVVFGYNYSKPIAIAKNAEYREIGFDGFEDYEWRDCDEDHFSFKDYFNNLVNTESHTGRKSIKVGSGESITITKQLKPCGN